MFLQENLHINPRVQAVACDFVRAAFYYGRTLIQGTFAQLQWQIAMSDDTPMPLAESLSITNQAITNMRSMLRRLRLALEQANLPAHFPSTMVPSAGPYQLLHQALLERIDLSTLDDQNAGSLLCKYQVPVCVSQGLMIYYQYWSLTHREGLNLAEIATQAHPGFVKVEIPGGYPAMTFVALYPLPLPLPLHVDRFAVLLGCSKPQWGQLKEVAAVTRAARD